MNIAFLIVWAIWSVWFSRWSRVLKKNYAMPLVGDGSAPEDFESPTLVMIFFSSKQLKMW